MKKIPKGLKMFTKLLLAFVVILAVFAIYQSIMYRIEGGVFVADGYTNPPLSTLIYHKGKPLSEAVVSTLQVGNIDSSGKRTYHQQPFVSWDKKWAYWNAIRKFPTLEKCLEPEGRDTRNLSKFSWASMRTSHQVEVCLFHLAAQLKEPQKIVSWAEKQGFSADFFEGLGMCFTRIKDCSELIAVWRRTGETIDSPYPFFSTQTLLEQYTLWSLLLGHSGLPEWQISMDEKQQAFSIRIRNSPNK